MGSHILRGSAQHAPHRRQTTGDEAGGVEIGDTDRQIVTAFDDIDEFVAEHQIDRQVRVPLHECLQMRRNMHAPKGGGGGDFQRAIDGVGPPGHEILGVLQPLQHGKHPLVKALARFGQ